MTNTLSNAESGAFPEYLSPLEPGIWRLDVWVQPRATRTALAGDYQACLKIQLAAPAVDNKANKALVAFVADLAGLKRGDVELVGGMTSRKKSLRLHCGKESLEALVIR